MIEIIPNWHPIFVHFTIALFTTSVIFYWLAYITSLLKVTPKSFMSEFEIVARWCLWIGAIITIIFLLILFIVEGALLSTAWHGGELVYRYGVGVMSLPKSGESGHHNHHSDE